MIGQFISLPYYRGEFYVTNAGTFAILNGQVLSRAAYPSLSAVWAEGMYGSTDTDIVLPDFTNSYLRSQDLGAGLDPDVNTRVPVSGTIPSGDSPGSFQFGAVRPHRHLRSQNSRNNGNGPNPAFQQPLNAGQTSTNFVLSNSVSSFTIISPSGDGTVDETLYEPANYLVFPYIRVA